MEAKELFRTCANEHVAAGALLSLGGALLRRIDAAASSAEVSRGALAAGLVVEYDRKASPAMRRQLMRSMRRAQMPILAGLRHVLDASLRGVFDVAPRRSRFCRWSPPALTPPPLWTGEGGSLGRGALRQALH
jgi:hypothetical protein